jgi:hypothetical protein
MATVALVTGGGDKWLDDSMIVNVLTKLLASAMGLAVASSLSLKGWNVNIADLSVEAGSGIDYLGRLLQDRCE